MVRILILILSFISLTPVVAQNLLLNGDFESFSQPQKSASEIIMPYYADFWTPVFNKVWSTVDFFCKSNIAGREYTSFSTPLNTFGYHPPRSGTNYIGLGLFNLEMQLEHITGKLDVTLEQDSCYTISLFVRHPGSQTALLPTRLEMLFSSDSLNFNFQANNILYSTDNNYNTKFENKTVKADLIFDIPSDTGVWIPLSTNYIAKGGEKYLSIGLFSQSNKQIGLIRRYCKRYKRLFNNRRKRGRFLQKVAGKTDSFFIFNEGYDDRFWFNGEVPIGTYDYSYILIDKIQVKLAISTR